MILAVGFTDQPKLFIAYRDSADLDAENAEYDEEHTTDEDNVADRTQ